MFLKNTMFWKLDLFLSSGKIMGASTPVIEEPNIAGVPIILPEDGNRFSFQNVVFF
jgi:hypothetical protein